MSITGNFGPGSLSFGVDQDGKSVGSFTWGNDYVHIGSQPELDGWGWSIPFGIGSIGEEYTPTGRYGTLYVGHPNVGLTVSVNNANPTTSMEALGANKFELLDKDGNLIGYQKYVPVPDPVSG